jgi:hypothetical protein
MGPPSEDGGNHGRQVCEAKRSTASMGPPSEDGGNGSCKFNCRFRYLRGGLRPDTRKSLLIGCEESLQVGRFSFQ